MRNGAEILMQKVTKKLVVHYELKEQVKTLQENTNQTTGESIRKTKK